MGKSNGNGSGKPRASDRDITALLSMQYRIPTVNLDEYVVAGEIIALVPRAMCEEFDVLPVSRAGNSLIVAMADPTNEAAVKALAQHTGYTIEKVIATEAAIREAVTKYYDEG